VFFTILLVAGSTMSQAVRERIGELGVLKAIGFTPGQVLGLVLAESCTLAVARRWTRLGLAWLLTVNGDPTGGLLPLFNFRPATCCSASGSAWAGRSHRSVTRAAGDAPARRGRAAEVVTRPRPARP
jgi:hypothetical protein